MKELQDRSVGTKLASRHSCIDTSKAGGGWEELGHIGECQWGQDRVQGGGWWTGWRTAARRLLATEDYQTSGALLKPQSSTAGAGNPVRQKLKVQTSLSRGFQGTWEMRNSGKHRVSQVNSRVRRLRPRSQGGAGGAAEGASQEEDTHGGSWGWRFLAGWEQCSLALKEVKAVGRFQRRFGLLRRETAQTRLLK